MPLAWTFAPGAWPTIRMRAEAPICSTGRGPSGNCAAQTWQARTARSNASRVSVPARRVAPDSDRAERADNADVDFVDLPMLAAASLVFLVVLAGLVSMRIGFSFLLVALATGTRAGLDGTGGCRFDDLRSSVRASNLVLAVILPGGRLRTEYVGFRPGLRPALPLSTLVVLTHATIGRLAAVSFVGRGWRSVCLSASIAGSTAVAAAGLRG